jgi:RNA polymerase sigma-70 factor, ECF subfamily
MPTVRRLRAVQGDALPAEAVPVLTEEQIIAGLADGEHWAAEALYDRLESIVERTLRRVLQASNVDYDDLVQVTFERIVRTLVERRFSGACSLSTWASAIAGHVGIDALRARARERGLLANHCLAQAATLPTVSGAERQLEARSEIAQLQQILASMNPQQAETLMLHDALGHELSEIAVMTGVSVAAAQSRLVRGRKELLRRARMRLTKGEA